MGVEKVSWWKGKMPLSLSQLDVHRGPADYGYIYFCTPFGYMLALMNLLVRSMQRGQNLGNKVFEAKRAYLNSAFPDTGSGP